jgi:bifunctional DNase/RNase
VVRRRALDAFPEWRVYRARKGRSGPAPSRAVWSRCPVEDTEAAVRELSVVGVRVELPSNQPIVLLKEVDGDRYLPIWIGAVEATAIAYEQQGVKPPRPLTHDLMRDILAALKAPLTAVEIVEMKENIFYADLLIGEGIRVSARPSDSIALALRIGAPIRCTDEVLAEAGIVIPDEQEDEVEKFREFLDQVSPEDFAG